jgi:hypothetical protein
MIVRPDLAEGGEGHQDQKRDFLHDKTERQGYAVGSLDEGDIRRRLPSGEPGRDQPGDPAGG